MKNSKTELKLAYSEQVDMDEDAIQRCVSPKEELGVFAARKHPVGPNYASKDVLQKLREKFPTLNFDEDADTKS